MAWEYVNCAECNEEYRVQMYGKIKQREWKVENWNGICDDCKEQLRQQELKDAQAAAQEIDLPALEGSEKQIAWAEKIRIQLVEKFNETAKKAADGGAANLNKAIEAFEKACENPSASWWIDYRDWYDFTRMLQKIHEEAEKAEQSNAAAIEATVYPEAPVTQLVTEFKILDDQIQILLPEKNEDFRKLIKPKGYRWSGSTWVRYINKFNGPVEDRAAEIGHMLLAGGFPIRVYNESIRQVAISGGYQREITRWVMRRDSRFAIRWPYEDDLYKEAKKLDGAKYDRTHKDVTVPLENFEEVLDFARIHDFTISDGAQEAIEAARQAKDAALVVAIKKKEEKRQIKKDKPVLAVEATDIDPDLTDNL